MKEVQAVGKGACVQGQEIEIPHGWMDSEVREEVIKRSRGPEETKAWRVSWAE